MEHWILRQCELHDHLKFFFFIIPTPITKCNKEVNQVMDFKLLEYQGARPRSIVLYQKFELGQNGQIPPFSEICSKKTLFWNYIGKYHFLWYSSFLNSSSQKFCHRGTAEVEIGQLKKIMWYSSMVNSSTMQHNTRVYQARVPFYNKMLFLCSTLFKKLFTLFST